MADPRKPPSPDNDDADEIFAEEKERQAKQDVAVAASWSKKVLVGGTGREAWQGARATLHIVGRLSHEDGDIFEDSRSREEPQLVLLGRGSVVLGLDRALLAMREGLFSTTDAASLRAYTPQRAGLGAHAATYDEDCFCFGRDITSSYHGQGLDSLC